MTEKEKAPQGCHNKIILEFITKGTPGPTIDTQTKTYLIELHFNDKKHLIRIPSDLEELIPSFSILKIVDN